MNLRVELLVSDCAGRYRVVPRSGVLNAYGPSDRARRISLAIGVTVLAWRLFPGQSSEGSPVDGSTVTAASASSLTGRLKELYDNLPLPLPIVAALALDLLLDRLRRVPLPGSRSLHRMAGAGLVLAGVGLNLWALAERRRHTAGRFALERPEELVATGPYAITRHPMYVGWWLIQLGAGTLAGSSWVLATLPAELLVEHRGVLHEEAMVAELFPESYPDYAERVPRYFGFPSLELSLDLGQRR
jgi:protein-S-isoprenylcysteine O-methyltransferase Ste14